MSTNDLKNTRLQVERQSHHSDTGYRSLEVNFSWRKFNAIIMESSKQEPIYLATFNPLTMKVKFRAGDSATKAAEQAETKDDHPPSNDTDCDIIGDGQVHPFKIDCQTHVRGRPVRVSAAKKILTRYTYPSLAYAPDTNRPAIMTWKASSNIKVFDFVLLDESDQPVAKFNPRYTGVRKLATIELLGPKAHDPRVVDEVVITGLSLYFTMIYRASNPVPLIGALVSRPGKDYKVTAKHIREEEEKNLANASTLESSYEPKFEDPEKLWDHVIEGTKT